MANKNVEILPNYSHPPRESNYYSVEEIEKMVYKLILSYVNVNMSELPYNLFLSFSLGIVSAPLGSGIFYLLLFFIFYEVMYGLIKWRLTGQYVIIRVFLIIVYILGYYLGRHLIGDNNPCRLFYHDKRYGLGRKDYCYQRDFDQQKNNKLYQHCTGLKNGFNIWNSNYKQKTPKINNLPRATADQLDNFMFTNY